MSGSLYPVAVDDVTSLPPPGPNTVTNTGAVTHAILHDNEILALQALETKLGIGSSTSTTSTILRASSNGTSVWGKLVLTSDVTGTLPVANGGTGITSLGSGIATFLGTPSSANLLAAVTDETGSGLLVFGSSPTIVTPTITSFTNAQHNHANAAGGGQLSGTTALTNGTVTVDKFATGATSAVVVTSETTASTSFVDLATTSDSVTVTIGSNGVAIVIITSELTNSGANSTRVSFAVSGATTLAASDSRAIINQGANDNSFSWSYVATGLTPGSTTFKMKYRVSGGTGTFLNRYISVVPL